MKIETRQHVLAVWEMQHERHAAGAQHQDAFVKIQEQNQWASQGDGCQKKDHQHQKTVSIALSSQEQLGKWW